MISRVVAILATILLAVGAQPALAQGQHGYGGGGFGRGGFGFGGRGYGGGRFNPGYPPPRGGWGRTPGYPGGYNPPPYRGPQAPNSLDLGWRQQQNEVRRAVREGRQVPLSQAIDAVRRRAPGHELDAGLEPGADGRPVYRLRWAGQDGRRTDYMVDAGTGRVLGTVGGP